MASLDQFINMDLLNDNPSNQSQQQPIIVGQDQQLEGTDGMSFADMFRQYLGPEVAKLPPSSTSNSADVHPYAEDASLFAPTDSFSPSAFMPNIPGSPIGAFSPSSDNSGGHHRMGGSLSPMSFEDLDTGLDDSTWSIDPSFFGTASGEPSLEPVAEEQVEHEEEEQKPDISTLDLPALPVAPAPAAAGTTSHKRQASASVAASDGEDDDDDMSDSSVAPVAKGKKTKKLPKTSVAAFASSTLHPTSAKSTLAPVPEWNDRPDPEEYKKLNSKEKRQLRNKISARNFRHRRKEYITTLEEEISSRDTIISQLRDEVGVMKTENSDLKSEVTLLKQKWDEMMEKMTSLSAPPTSTSTVGIGAKLPSPAASSSSSEEWALDSPKMAKADLPVASGSGTRSSRRTGQIAKPNLNKDVAPSLKRGTGSWTTAGGFGGGYMPVHTTLVPEMNFAHSLNPKLAAYLQPQNFNPALNNLSASQMAQLPNSTAHLNSGSTKGISDDFFGSNPFWLKPENVEEYRGQLYGKVAHNMAGVAAAQKQAGANANSSPNAGSPNGTLPIPTGFRPAFFSSPSSALSGKEPRDVSPSSTSASELMAAQTPFAHQQTSAYVAGLATQTLFSRMAAAFSDAFVGNDGKMESAKVASVLSGKSRLQVVNNNSSARPASPSIDSLGMQLGALDLDRPTTPQSRRVNSCTFDDVCRKWTGKGN